MIPLMLLARFPICLWLSLFVDCFLSRRHPCLVLCLQPFVYSFSPSLLLYVCVLVQPKKGWVCHERSFFSFPHPSLEKKSLSLYLYVQFIAELEEEEEDSLHTFALTLALLCVACSISPSASFGVPILCFHYLVLLLQPPPKNT